MVGNFIHQGFAVLAVGQDDHAIPLLLIDDHQSVKIWIISAVKEDIALRCFAGCQFPAPRIDFPRFGPEVRSSLPSKLDPGAVGRSAQVRILPGQERWCAMNMPALGNPAGDLGTGPLSALLSNSKASALMKDHSTRKAARLFGCCHLPGRRGISFLPIKSNRAMHPPNIISQSAANVTHLFSPLPIKYITKARAIARSDHIGDPYHLT